jgi:hypothetical protein
MQTSLCVAGLIAAAARDGHHIDPAQISSPAAARNSEAIKPIPQNTTIVLSISPSIRSLKKFREGNLTATVICDPTIRRS